MDPPPLTRGALAAFEDAQQARALAQVTLYADMHLERVLRGPRKGQDLGDALDAELRAMDARMGVASLRLSVVRPWWAAFCRVRQLQLIPPEVPL